MAKEKIKISGGASGIIAVILTLLFGFIGAFFSWWLIARWNILKSFLYSFVFFLAFLVSVLLCVIFVGYILIPIVWIVMVIMVYQACSKSQIEVAEIER